MSAATWATIGTVWASLCALTWWGWHRFKKATRDQDDITPPQPDDVGTTAPSTPQSWRDRDGDVWTLGIDGLLHSPETRPFVRSYVEKKWGPLVPVDGGEQ